MGDFDRHQWLKTVAPSPIQSQLGVIGVFCDAFADLLVGSLHLGMVSADVLACEAEELVVVRPLEMMAARTFDCSHVSSLERACVEVSDPG